ncbi:MAG: conjugal transfer nickase/helicase domain-containing protein [Gammaproteobacteria bacterium]
MDEPLPRGMPAVTSPRPSEAPEPAVDRPEPVAAVGAPQSRGGTGTEVPAFTNAVDLGQAFLAWLKQGLVSSELPVNTVNARVHRVQEGVLLVSPGIFRDYGTAAQAPWASIQKRFQKLKLHRKTPEGFNIWTYKVAGERRTRELKGILLEDPERAFGAGVILPPPNPHVVLAQGKKG